MIDLFKMVSVVVLPVVLGLSLGTVFFGGLWWTIRKALSSRHPEIWFISSIFLRTTIVLLGFYLICDGHFERLLICLLAFSVAGMAAGILSRVVKQPLNSEQGV